MERHWLISALAAVALAAAPVKADEQAPNGDKSPAPETPVTQSGTGTQPAPAPAADEKDSKPAADGVKLAQPPRAQTGQPPMGPEAEKKPTPPPPAVPKFTYGGSVDGYFTANLNDPNPQAFGRRRDGLNLYHAF